MTKTKLATNFDKAEDSPGFLLWQLTNKWQAQQRAALKAFNLTHVQFVLLATLTYATNETGLTQKQLAQYAQIDVMMTSQVVRKLEEKGLVKRQVNKADGRAFSVKSTPGGISLVNEAVTMVEAVDSQFFGRLKSIDLRMLVETMRELIGSQ